MGTRSKRLNLTRDQAYDALFRPAIFKKISHLPTSGGPQQVVQTSATHADYDAHNTMENYFHPGH
jgi:hypothetical protein